MSGTSTFWRDKRVFITGHTGFKGSWLSLRLSQLGAQVCGYALDPPSEPSLFATAAVASHMQSIHGDIRNLDKLQGALLNYQPDVIFHLAAQALVRASYADPVTTYATNVMGTVNLLAAATELKSDCAVVNVTSDKCYAQNGGALSFKESDAMGGHDPYSSSKGCAELVSHAFGKSFFSAPNAHGARIALASARSGNVIGGGDWAQDRLLPDAFRALCKRRPLQIRYPDAVRPWQHVLDPLNGYVILAEKLSSDAGEYSGGWNFGPEEKASRPVSWIVDRFLAAWPDAPAWERLEGVQLHEAAELRLDCTHAHTRLGWKPLLGIQEGLNWCVDWYKRFQQGESAGALTLEQIERYEQLTREVKHGA